MYFKFFVGRVGQQSMLTRLDRLSQPICGCQTHKGSYYQNHSSLLNCGNSVKSDVCMASPSSVRAVEQWGSEDESQGEKTVSILRFIIHWTVPGRRQPLLEELEGRGGSAGGIPKRMVHVQCGVLSVDPVRGLNVAARWPTTLAKFTSPRARALCP